MNMTHSFSILLFLVVSLDCCIAMSDDIKPKGHLTPTLRGVCFGPYRSNQNPDCGVYPTIEEIRKELLFIKEAGIAPKLRTYSCVETLSNVPKISMELGLECWPGAWLGNDRCANEREIQALIEVGKLKLPNCPALIVGNEVLLRKDLSEDELILFIQRVKKETGMLVAYADCVDFRKYPKVVKVADILLLHLYPYWDGESLYSSMDALLHRWDRTTKAYPEKRILIGETGWPADGNSNGKAIPSPKNQATYLKEFLKTSRKKKIDYFYFSLLSESWKARTNEGPQGAHWGLLLENGKLRPHLKTLFSKKACQGMKLTPGKIPQASALNLPAFIYRNACSEENRFYPTIWMGDVDDLKLNISSVQNPRSEPECIEVKYSIAGQRVKRLESGQTRAKGWAGVYWLGPYFNHWGDYPGYTLKGASRLTFWARGERGGERISFKTGGIRSNGKPFHDSFGPILERNDGPTILTNQWVRYSIELDGVNTSSMLGGFCVAIAEVDNPNGCVFYLDDIVIVKGEP